jgi:hypothetical protein
MKIAVCFSGQIRTGVQTAPNILRYIGDLRSECDIFVHTWDIKTDPNQQKPDDPNILINVDRSVFSEFYRLYNPLYMVVEPYRLRAVASTWGGERVDAKTGRNYVSMFESIYESNQIKMIHEQKHGFVYDRVIRIRPDLTFNPTRNLRDDLIAAPIDDKTFVSEYHKSNFNDGKLEDIYWVASSPVMDKICNFHEHRASSGSRGDWQVEMANWVKSPDLGLIIKRIGADHDVRILREKDTLDVISEWDKIPVN